MPNWCHNTLTVRGDATEVQNFLDRAAPNSEMIESWYKASSESFERTGFDDPGPFDEFAARHLASQPFSFYGHVPQPSDEELKQWEEAVDCPHCVAGRRPYDDVMRFCDGDEDRVQAWYEQMNGCNCCRGTTRYVQTEGWYAWRLANWGTKWDASFGEPFFAMGTDEMDVDVSTEMKTVTWLPEIDGESSAAIKFDTAWGPPTEWLAKASELHPELTLTLRYAEPGNEFAGEETLVAGACVSRHELDVEEVLEPEEMWF